MSQHKRAGEKALTPDLINVEQILTDYTHYKKSLSPVSFGTSGHRGVSSKGSFNESHILATTQAVCEYRKSQGLTGPLFIGADTHALSEEAQKTALSVLAANEVAVRYARDFEYIATPVVSHAILNWNRQNSAKADGIVITPSHNPPECGGFKYNGADGGPAAKEATDWIQNRANELMQNNLQGLKICDLEIALKNADFLQADDFIKTYVNELTQVIDIAAIKEAGIRIGVDPLGGAALPLWKMIAEVHGLDIDIVNDKVDSQFAFMNLDRDGAIRMDCSSPWAMNGLIALKDSYNIACGNDPDSDRHGIVTPDGGLMNPNHYLAVSARYLFENRPQWPASSRIGKTCVSSDVISRLGKLINREVYEVPVGFKWFVSGMEKSDIAFCGEESAGASFLRLDGSPWSTDKDGIIACLLAAEMCATTKKSPSQLYNQLVEDLGSAAPLYARSDAAASPAQKAKLASLSPESLNATSLAGDKITTAFSHAPGNKAAIGGIKVVTANGWFAARPSGTEDIYKIYAESFVSAEHLQQIQQEAEQIVLQAIGS